MTTLAPLTINITPEQRQKIEHLAEINGYDTADAYALAILEQFIDEPTEEQYKYLVENFVGAGDLNEDDIKVGAKKYLE